MQETLNMIRQPKWTRREIDDLKKLYETGIPYQTIADTLRRTVSAIKTRGQMCGLRRPRGLARKEIEDLKEYAANLGLDETVLPTNPTALRLLICLAKTGVSSKLALDKMCSVGESARNKAIQSLSSLGLVFVDDFCSPAEVILKRKAYRTRPKPVLADHDQIKMGVLPTMTKLHIELDAWLPACYEDEASIEENRAFIVRQLQNAQSGDVSPADFYSIFYSLNRK